MTATSLHVSPLAVAASAAAITQNQSEHTTKHSSETGSIKFRRNLNEVKQLHAQITKKSLNNHTNSTFTKIISLCAEIATPESLQYARKSLDLFDISTVSLYTFNSLIRGYSIAGLCNEAISLYLGMVSEGVNPDHYTFPFALSACAKGEAFLEGIQLHGSVVKMGLGEDVFIQNSLIHFYFECGEVDFGKKVFDEMSERNVVSWTSLICGYARRDRPSEAVSMFFEMVETGIEPNSITMVCVISACAKLRDLELGERVCVYLGESGLKINGLLVNALVDMYMKCGATERAKQLFDDCLDENLVLYNTILSNYVRQGMEKEALAILIEMLRQGPKPDRVTMLSAVSASAQLGEFSFGRQCHCYILRNGLDGWDSVSNAIIDMYTKCGKQELACRVFDRMSTKTVVSWNTLIAGFVRNGDVESAWGLFNQMPETDLVSWNTMIGALVQESLFEDAIELFRVMQSEGIKADKVTMVSVASACGYLGAVDLAKWAYRYIERTEIHCDLKLGTALVDMFARCGDTESAVLVFNKTKERDVSAWTAVIGAMALEGNGIRAIELFDEMLEQGLKPDVVAFVEVLMACSHAGLVDQGKRLFQSMKEKHGVSPQIVHYGCMVDLLGRAGLLSEALDLIEGMPMEPNSVVWGALLAACRTCKNDKMAAYAAERIRLIAHDKIAVSIVLLFQTIINASAGKWTDVARVRLQMKERGLRKVPGSSSIEIDGVIHEFTSSDESHPEMTDIALMLQEMNCRIRDVGHVPDLTNVLLDVDDREKEFLLSRHSEKRAMAFGLLRTSQGTPIRVVKNLRMCSDCHSFAKLVSEIYSREIVVRDNNRFHIFQQGLCSCNDFW
ncbi:LOW QUALITY PROTEIN: pentatricopeptide repeat-containing protein At3g22690-like [Camellia sinensis]|uniref:LOW QUALITY PROTEIN: pentatricopeptide repeat-containing protein At3g22690-like n=1 Tax=Camellia sinensis TaxID=4442 RepID=UPI00103672F2|nr:LOW QUALITY PROTEIN: pentatricopeptide repeat-containing protein At3g22690-like [Camellia sinensis]